TDVYAVGFGGTIVHSADGASFTRYAGGGAPPTTTNFSDVWGSATLGVYAAGTDGTSASTRVLYRSTDHGPSWSQVNIPGFTGTAASGNALTTVFALGSDVWVAGDRGNVYHSSDGTNFAQENTGVTAYAVVRLRGISGLLIATLGNDPGSYLSSTNNGTTW